MSGIHLRSTRRRLQDDQARRSGMSVEKLIAFAFVFFSSFCWAECLMTTVKPDELGPRSPAGKLVLERVNGMTSLAFVSDGANLTAHSEIGCEAINPNRCRFGDDGLIG